MSGPTPRMAVDPPLPFGAVRSMPPALFSICMLKACRCMLLHRHTAGKRRGMPVTCHHADAFSRCGRFGKGNGDHKEKHDTMHRYHDLDALVCCARILWKKRAAYRRGKHRVLFQGCIPCAGRNIFQALFYRMSAGGADHRAPDTGVCLDTQAVVITTRCIGVFRGGVFLHPQFPHRPIWHFRFRFTDGCRLASHPSGIACALHRPVHADRG